jgi:hypothetical protein
MLSYYLHDLNSSFKDREKTTTTNFIVNILAEKWSLVMLYKSNEIQIDDQNTKMEQKLYTHFLYSGCEAKKSANQK